jgi:hypothetical protein
MSTTIRSFVHRTACLCACLALLFSSTRATVSPHPQSHSMGYAIQVGPGVATVLTNPRSQSMSSVIQTGPGAFLFRSHSPFLPRWAETAIAALATVRLHHPDLLTGGWTVIALLLTLGLVPLFGASGRRLGQMVADISQIQYRCFRSIHPHRHALWLAMGLAVLLLGTVSPVSAAMQDGRDFRLADKASVILAATVDR